MTGQRHKLSFQTPSQAIAVTSLHASTVGHERLTRDRFLWFKIRYRKWSFTVYFVWCMDYDKFCFIRSSFFNGHYNIFINPVLTTKTRKTNLHMYVC